MGDTARILHFYFYERHREGGASDGFQWFDNYTKALKVRQADFALATCKEDQPGSVCGVWVPRTKAGILKALKDYASHPDNG